METVAARKEWRTVPDPSLPFTAINLYLCILFSILFDVQKLHEYAGLGGEPRGKLKGYRPVRLAGG
jgi:hypothetical protein